LKAILHNGKTYATNDYNTSTVTLATKSGKPDVITWAEVDYLIGDDGLERHREVVEGMPKIIVQAPKNPGWQPMLIAPSQTDMFSAPTKCPQDDFEDAIALIEMVETKEEREAVREVLGACFEGENKRRLWGRLSFEQRGRLKSKEPHA
jgi:hypothetical protein